MKHGPAHLAGRRRRSVAGGAQTGSMQPHCRHACREHLWVMRAARVWRPGRGGWRGQALIKGVCHLNKSSTLQYHASSSFYQNAKQ